MLQKITLYFLSLTVVSVIFACSSQSGQKEHAQHEMQNEEWTEMEAYHNVMAETFHPVEEGNFEPIKSRANELAETAAVWASSNPPANLKSLEVKAMVKDLADSTQAFAAIVKSNAENEIIKKKFDALHDQFHKVVGKCTEH